MAHRRPLTATCLVCFCAGALYGWSALVAPLQVHFAITLAQSGLVFSLALLAFTAAVITAPFASARIGVMRVLALSAGCGALCICAAAFAPGFALFTAAFSLGFGAMSGAIYSAALSLAASHARARIATPVMVACFGLGGAVFGPLWRGLGAQGWGLSALLPLAGALFLCAIFAAMSARAHSTGALRAQLDDTPLPRAVLLLVWALFAAGTFAGLMVLGMASKIMDDSGAAVMLVSAVLAAVAVANTSGRLGAAWLSVQRSLWMSCALSLGGLAIAASSAAVPWAMGLGLVCIAAGYGLMASSVPLLTARSVGPARFGRAFGVVFTAWGAAGFIAPWMAGMLFDRHGDFMLAYLCAALSSALCLPLIWALQRRVPLGSNRALR